MATQERSSQTPNVRFSLSTEAVFFPEDVVFGGLSVENFSDLAQELGYEQLHLFPFNGRYYRQIRSGQITGNWSSGEESFYSENTWKRRLTSDNKLGVLYSMLTVAERLDSADTLLTLQKHQPDTFLIIYPHHARSVIPAEPWDSTWNEQMPTSHTLMKHVLVRPNPDLLTRFGVDSELGIAEFAQKKLGCEGIALNAKYLNGYKRLAEAKNGFIRNFGGYTNQELQAMKRERDRLAANKKDVVNYPPVFEQLVEHLLPKTRVLDIHVLPNAEAKTQLKDMVDHDDFFVLTSARQSNWKGLVIVHYPLQIFAGPPFKPSVVLQELASHLG